MKKLTALAFAVLFSVILAHAQDGWVNHKVDNRVSIKFPYEPKEVIPGTFIAFEPDSSVVYIFTLVDFARVANIDSTALAPVKATPEFAAGIKTGITQTLPGVDLADFTIGTYKGYTSYNTSGFDAKRKRYDLFMFIVGTNFYSLSTITADGKPLDKRDKFFASINIAP